MKTKNKIEKVSRDIDTADDWDLIVDACHWGHKIASLNRLARAELYSIVWAESDGYGPKGYIPDQGYDWSGVRDSSDAAKKAMADAARKWWKAGGFLNYVVEITRL